VLQQQGDRLIDRQPVRVQKRVVVTDGIQTQPNLISTQGGRGVGADKRLDSPLFLLDLLLDLPPGFALVG